MSKFVVRWTIILVSCYLTACYLCAALTGVNIWRQFYYLLFEFCVCLSLSKQGKYHCKYIKWTAYAIFIEDSIVCSDLLLDYIPDNVMAVISPLLLMAGLALTTILAVRHYLRIKTTKRRWQRRHRQ